ncbi:MAG TPA: helix-turn-helix domain-containing protein [Ktedonobacteraceae bacterium]|nr:helix-turn-helix domain-containing protein [Ktedonobacteraceae bacterium]
MNQKRAFKYRVYPTPEQQPILARTFGCCRYVYNWALRKKRMPITTNNNASTTRT